MVSLSLSSRFQSSAQWWVVFMSVYEGESFPPGMLHVPQPGAWLLSQHRGKWRPASVQRQDFVWWMFPRQGTVVLIKSENHIRTKFGWKQVKAGARWRGKENGGVLASPLKKKMNERFKLKDKVKAERVFYYHKSCVLECLKWSNGLTVWVAELLHGRF